jgi:hypothetical protein
MLFSMQWLHINLCFFYSTKKGYKLTKQGKGLTKMGWKQIASETEGRKMSSDMTNADKPAHADINMSSISPGSLLFSREVGSFLT